MTPDRQNDRRVPPSLSDPSKPQARERMTARPAVLRALTDLFCLREDPIDEEVSRFRELALQIIPDAGPSTRLYVAAKLARHPKAPRDVLEKLAENDPPCATLLLEHARNFSIEAQLNAALNASRASAIALAARQDLAPSVSEALVTRNDPHVTRALADNPHAKLTPAAVSALKKDGRPDRIYAAKLEAHAPAPPPPPEHFLNASQDARARLILSARRATLGRANPPVMREEALIADLKDFAIARNWNAFTSALAQKTGLRGDVARRLIEDEGGEPLALLLSLIGADQSDAIRIFLCCEPPISHAYQRVRDLALITAETPATVAGALIFSMTGARPRISTYAGAPERRQDVQAESPRALEAKPVAAPEARPATKTRVILRRQIR
jgi:hypothetical protein